MTGVAARTGTVTRVRAAAVRHGVLVAALVAVAACGPAGDPAPPTPSVTATPSAPASPPDTPSAVPTTAGTTTGGAGASDAPVAPGSGSTADRAAVGAVLRTYLQAVADGDFAAACALNAPETNQRLLDELARRGAPAASCEEAIARLYAGAGVAQGAATIADTLQVQRVDVTGDAATVAWSVEVSGRRPVVTNALRRVDGQWRLLPTPDPAG